MRPGSGTRFEPRRAGPPKRAEKTDFFPSGRGARLRIQAGRAGAANSLESGQPGGYVAPPLLRRVRGQEATDGVIIMASVSAALPYTRSPPQRGLHCSIRRGAVVEQEQRQQQDWRESGARYGGTIRGRGRRRAGGRCCDGRRGHRRRGGRLWRGPCHRGPAHHAVGRLRRQVWLV